MSVAKSYARALFESLQDSKADSSQFDKMEQQFGQVLATLKDSKDLNELLVSPLTSVKEKTALVGGLSGKMELDRVFVEFLKLLVKKGRLSLLSQMKEEFRSARLTQEGAISGQVVSAEGLEEADIRALEKAFGKKLGKKVVFQLFTDSSLLAGMKVTVNGVTYDGTLRSQLQKLRDSFALGSVGHA